MSSVKDISQKDKQAIAAGLSVLLADSYTLYLKTHNYHWNVTGPMFQTLHLMFEQHYTELALAVDLWRRCYWLCWPVALGFFGVA